MARKRTSAATARPILGRGVGGQAELYDKGAMLLIELENRIGRARMDELVSAVARLRIAETDAFLGELRRLSDEATSNWFAEKLAS